jgi:hypothetical protein
MTKKIVLVRGVNSGVHFGELISREGQEVTLKNARRVWYWEGANALDQLAMEGSAKPERCKITVVVDEILILDAIEIIPLTERAFANLNGIAPWKF